MTGLTNYTANNTLNWLTGQIAEPALPSVWMALFTAVGTDAGTGFTEVSGNGYTRIQIAGTATAAGTISTASATITMPNVSGFPWVVPGMTVYDVTAAQTIGVVLSWVGTTLTLTANSLHNGSGSTDSLSFSMFPNGSGTGPASITNGGVITFPLATTSGFGTCIAWGFYDASSSGNLLCWDYMGNFAWLPATVSSASPGVITTKAHGYSNGDSFVFSTEYGGTAPTFSAGNYTGLLTVAGVTTDTLNVTGVNTSATGDGMIRKVTQQSVPAGVTLAFAASSISIQAA
jgi:hypothetical protein